jgi:hypothetical protein
LDNELDSGEILIIMVVVTFFLGYCLIVFSSIGF